MLVVGQDRDGGQAVLFTQGPDARWRLTAVLPHDFARCNLFRDKLRAGEFGLVSPKLKDLEIAGRRIRFAPVDDPGANCPNTKK